MDPSFNFSEYVDAIDLVRIHSEKHFKQNMIVLEALLILSKKLLEEVTAKPHLIKATNNEEMTIQQACLIVRGFSYGFKDLNSFKVILNDLIDIISNEDIQTFDY